MEKLLHYFMFDRRIRRKNFIIIMAAYWLIGALLSVAMAPSSLNGSQTHAEIVQATSINYYILGMLITVFVVPAYAGRLMDMAISPFFAGLFLLPFIFNLAMKAGNVELPYADIVGLALLLAQLVLLIRRGTKGANKYGPDSVV